MSIALQQGRPPIVRFEQVAIEDRNASIEAGRKIYRDENHVFVRQQGSQDEVEKIAEEWLAQKSREAMEDKFPPALAEAYSKKYEMWLKGIEVLEGTPLKECANFSKAEVLTLAGAGVHSLEDLAELPETGLQLIDIGGREMRDRARDMLKASKDIGRVVEQVAALRVQVEGLQATNEADKLRIQELEAELAKKRRKA